MPYPPTPTRTGDHVIDEIVKNWNAVVVEQNEHTQKLRQLGASAERIAELERSHAEARTQFRALADRVAAIDTGRSMDAKDVAAFSMARCAVAATLAVTRKRAINDEATWKIIAPREFDVITSAARESADRLAALEKFFGSSDPATASRMRDMISTVDSQGAILIPTPAARNHLEFLRPYLPLIPLGATVIPDLVGFRVPIDTGSTNGVVAYWVDENGTPTKSDLAFNVNWATPHRLAARTNISNTLLRGSTGLIQAKVEQDMPRAMAEAFQTAALFGTGVSGQPKGLENWLATSYQSEIGPNATTGGRFSWRHIAQLQRRLLDRKVQADPATTGLLMAPIVEQLLRTEGIEMFQNQGADNGMPIMAPYMNLAALKEVLGRYEVSQLVPTDRTKTATDLSPVFYGDWRHLKLCQWGGYRMRASDIASDGTNHAFVQNMTMLIIEGELDVVVSRPEAFHEFTDCVTSV